MQLSEHDLLRFAPEGRPLCSFALPSINVDLYADTRLLAASYQFHARTYRSLRILRGHTRFEGPERLVLAYGPSMLLQRSDTGTFDAWFFKSS